jgi:GAG-pre-integrase domain/Integrase core domain
MDMDGFTFSIKDQCFSFYRDGIFYGSSQVMNGLYVLKMNNQVLNINNKRLKSSHESETLIWHHRLGHINETHIKKLQDVGLLGCFDIESIATCEKSDRSKDLLGLMHSDVCGPMSISARDGSRYFVTFTDDFSRYDYVYLMRHKSESFEKFKEFKAEVENQLGKKIKVFRTDWGGEYLSDEFRGYLKAHGIVPRLTPPGMPQWNDVQYERRNRTLLDMIRSMMSRAELSRSFWGFAFKTAAFMLNRMPSKSVEKTPYVLWFGRISNVSFIKIWDCEAYVKRLMSEKLSPRSDKCIFVGYPKEIKGYYFYYNILGERVSRKRKWWE